MTKRDCLTAERLRELLDYDSATGVFKWRSKGPGIKCAGMVAGCVAERRGIKYRAIRIDRQLYREHRLAWLYVHGEWPDALLDHRDGPSNGIGNLRKASDTQNLANMKLRADSTTGLKGVTQKYCNRWVAQLSAGGKTLYLGMFKTPRDAAEAYDRAAVERFGEFARTNKMLGLLP